MPKKETITFRAPERLASRLREQVEQQGETTLPHFAYDLLGILYFNNIFKTNPELAFGVLTRIRYSKKRNDRIVKMLKNLSRKLSTRKEEKEGVEHVGIH